MDVTIYWGKTGHLTASGDRDFVLSFILTPEEQILLAERRKGNE
jgi:hypothetical protein